MVANDNTIDRRDFLKSLGITTAAAASVPRVIGAAADEKPNVLFIAIDDLNDWTGCLGGHPQAQTPNIDNLARRGVLFSNAHCAAPACNPSRAALMTGIRPSTSGVYHNPQPWRESPVLKDAVSLTQYFMSHGYTAVGGGKIYHGRYPDPPSWDEYFPSKTKNRPPDPSPPEKNINGLNKAHFDWGPLDVPDAEMGDHTVVSWAIEQMRKKHDKPLFLACGIFRPHLPWYVPRKYFEQFPLDDIQLPEVKEDDLDDIPEIGKKIARPQGDHKAVTEHNQWRKAVQGYLASIAFTDAQVGRLIDAFDKTAFAKNTVICLWSDHGWHLGEKLHWRKFALWEEATRNILMFVTPGGATEGAVCGRPVNLVDMYPTLVELCGLPPKKGVEGTSLVPLLEDPAREWHPTLTTHGRGRHAVRSENWRYIRYSDGTEELYDRREDPMEWNNLAEKPEHAEIKKKLAAWLPEKNAEDSAYEKGKRRNKKKRKKK